MTSTQTDRKPVENGPPPHAALGAACLVVAPCLLTLCLANAAPQSRGRAAELSAACSALTYAAAAANDVTASPCVTSPSAPVARFGICERPLIASVIHVRSVAAVIIARIGGLYGP